MGRKGAGKYRSGENARGSNLHHPSQWLCEKGSSRQDGANSLIKLCQPAMSLVLHL